MCVSRMSATQRRRSLLRKSPRPWGCHSSRLDWHRSTIEESIHRCECPLLADLRHSGMTFPVSRTSEYSFGYEDSYGKGCWREGRRRRGRPGGGSIGNCIVQRRREWLYVVSRGRG